MSLFVLVLALQDLGGSSPSEAATAPVTPTFCAWRVVPRQAGNVLVLALQDLGGSSPSEAATAPVTPTFCAWLIQPLVPAPKVIWERGL